MSLLPPLYALIGLYFIMLLLMGRARVAAVKAKEVRVKEIALSNDGWPDNVKKFSNNYNNLFQMPLLFFVVCLIAFHVNYQPVWFVLCAWGYVVMRYIHSFIHCTSNHVMRRFTAFIVSNGFLLLMCIGLVTRL